MMLEGPTADPAGIFIAKLGSEYVGLTALELPESGPAITGTTGVLPEHRGRGVAMALKLLSFRYAAKRGYREARAHNDTANPPILRMNEKLGYRRLPGWLAWEKLPHRESDGITHARMSRLPAGSRRRSRRMHQTPRAAVAEAPAAKD